MNEFHSTGKAKLYWMMQLLGWFSLMFIEVYNLTFFILGEFNWQYVFSLGTLSGIGLLTTHLYKSFFIPSSTFSKNLRKIWGKAFLDIIFISLIIVLFGRLRSITAANSLLEMSASDLLTSVGPQLINTARYVMIWITIYYLYHILTRNNEHLKAKLEAEVATKTAELELLKSQLNPTFLFQTLSRTKSLVTEDKEKARESILKLSELLRYALNYEKNILVPVRHELIELHKYIDLEKIRLEQQLNVNFAVEENLLDEEIPTASLINLMEFAIRSGIETASEGIEIRLSGKSSKDSMRFQLIGNNQPSPYSESEVMKNLSLRLHRIYGKKAQLTFSTDPFQQIGCQLTLPKKQ